MPRIERLRQNTPEWYGWRLQGLGSSDAPVIMGDGAFMTPKALWSIKTGRAREDGDSLPARRGRELEQRARTAYEARTGVQMEPVCLVHERLEWMRASLDGLSFDGALVLEIKCPWSARGHVAAREGRIPPQYYAQLQHQLEVSQAREAHYWSFDGASGILVRVEPDREYVARLIEAEQTFWQRVLENFWPQETEGELDLSADPAWRTAAEHYREAKVLVDRAVLKEQQARQQLEKMAIAPRTYGCGIEVLRSLRKGVVDYASVPELRGVELEPYRKPPVEVVRINLSARP